MTTLAECIFSLQAQSVARGLRGELVDISVVLCEDSRTVSVWAFHEFPQPLMASFTLPARVRAEDFDSDAVKLRVEETEMKQH
jgi:hypothetical protein